MRHRGAAVAQPLHVLIVEPHAVRHGEALVDQAELVHVGGERGAVALVAATTWTFDSATWLWMPTSYSRARLRQAIRKSSLQWCGMVGATASTTFSNGHFCSALSHLLGDGFHGA